MQFRFEAQHLYSKDSNLPFETEKSQERDDFMTRIKMGQLFDDMGENRASENGRNRKASSNSRGRNHQQVPPSYSGVKKSDYRDNLPSAQFSNSHNKDGEFNRDGHYSNVVHPRQNN